MSPIRSITLPEELRSRFDYVQRVAFICGALGLALVILFSFHSEHSRLQFFRSYLFAFVYWISIPLGCQAILMMHHLTGGWWGYPIRRLLDALDCLKGSSALDPYTGVHSGNPLW